MCSWPLPLISLQKRWKREIMQSVRSRNIICTHQNNYSCNSVSSLTTIMHATLSLWRCCSWINKMRMDMRIMIPPFLLHLLLPKHLYLGSLSRVYFCYSVSWYFCQNCLWYFFAVTNIIDGISISVNTKIMPVMTWW